MVNGFRMFRARSRKINLEIFFFAQIKTMNKFLQGGSSDVTDGSTNIVGATLSAANLDFSKALKTNGSKVIISTDLAISDTTGLQASLDSKVGIPLAENLDVGGFDILNTPSITITDVSVTNSAELVYTGVTNIQIDVANLDDSSAPSTGVISGGLLNINVDPTKFDVSDGSGTIFDTFTLTTSQVRWSGLTAQSTTYVGDVTFISIDSSGSVVFSTSIPSNSQIRQNIFLGQIVHLDQINIIVTLGEQMTLLSTTNQIRDFMQAIGELNINGNLCSSNNLLTIAKSAGQILKFGGNFGIDVDNPHLPTSGAIDTNLGGGTPNQFAYRWQDGSERLNLTSIVPSEFDDGNGESAPGTVTNNRWSVQRVFTFSIGAMLIQQAQFTYGNQSAAVAAIDTEGFVVEAALAVTGTLICFLVLRGGGGDLSDPSDAQFLPASKFGGGTTGATSGVSGPLSSTDNTIVRWDGVTGALIQNSGVVIDDSDNITGVSGLAVTGVVNLNPIPSFDLLATDDTNAAVQIIATGGAASEIHIENTTGVTNDSVRIDSALGGVDLDAETNIFIDAATGRIDIRALGDTGGSSVQLEASAGSVDIDAAVNIDMDAGDGVSIDAGSGRVDIRANTSTAGGAIQLDASAGGINIDASTDISLDAATGRIDLRAVANTTASSVQLESSLGGVRIDAGIDIDMNAGSDIFMDATNGRIDLTAAVSSALNAIQLSAVTGGIDIDAATTITLNAISIDSSSNVTDMGTLNTRTIANWVDGTTGVADSRFVMWNGTSGKLVKQVSTTARLSGDALFGVTTLGLTNSGFSRNVSVGGVLTGNLALLLSPTNGTSSQFWRQDGTQVVISDLPLPAQTIQQIGAADFLVTTASDWPVSTDATLGTDVDRNSLSVRIFLNATGSGVGFHLQIPSRIPSLTSLTYEVAFRKVTAGTGTVKLDLNALQISQGTLVTSSSWNSTETIVNVDTGNNASMQLVSTSIGLTASGLQQGIPAYFQISRDVADTYTGTVYLYSINISMST